MRTTLFLSTVAAGVIAISASFANEIGAIYSQIVGDTLRGAQAAPPSVPPASRKGLQTSASRHRAHQRNSEAPAASRASD
jgi:hypothetical protein